MSELLKIRPYARLITMLGDQLIKNERIALLELVKNSYDADAEWVKVSFLDFNDDFSINDNSKIVIEDNGTGMDEEIIKRHWLNPATPVKSRGKKEKNTTDKGRFIQGEKGIGRFAIFKLGDKINICTRRQLQNDEGKFIDAGEDVENIVSYDFTKYDEDFSDIENPDHELFIDELQVEFQQRDPAAITKREIHLGNLIKERDPHGTIIEISALKTNWTENRIKQIQYDMSRLQPIFSDEESDDFHVWIYKNDEPWDENEYYKEKLLSCLNSKAVLRITYGYYSEKERSFEFYLNGKLKKLSFYDLIGIDAFRSYFKDAEGNVDPLYLTDCGDFRFQFYIFDLNASDAQYILDEEEKNLVKNHRIYLYRDKIRVLPYGDVDDDWLKIDMMRGIKSAGYYLSNDQVVGCIDISQKTNPKLKDKTNREGLLDEGRALDDFLNLLQVLLRYFRKVEYDKYLIDKKKRKDLEDEKNGKPLEIIKNIEEEYSKGNNIQKSLKTFEKSYTKEKTVYEDRIKTTENLAAVGLSVEMASHDVMILIRRALEQLSEIISELKSNGEVNKDILLINMKSLEHDMDLVYTQMKDIRLLFPSAKKRASLISVDDILNKVKQLYNRPFTANEIEVSQQNVNGSMEIKATESALLQVFVNLFDNALYWLGTIESRKKIIIKVNKSKRSIIFADNGPGIKPESVPYIFEAFYSEKGEDGRGLGLYIARQLLSRYGYEINVIINSDDMILPGANFEIRYKGE